jgi:hypothetical protein
MARGLRSSPLVKEEETHQRSPAAGEANRRYYVLEYIPLYRKKLGFAEDTLFFRRGRLLRCRSVANPPGMPYDQRCR